MNGSGLNVEDRSTTHSGRFRCRKPTIGCRRHGRHLHQQGENDPPAQPRRQVIRCPGVPRGVGSPGLGKARVIRKFKRPGDLEEAQLLGRKGLEVLERRLAGHQWLALDHLTIADVACFPYVALASEGEIPLDPYASVRSWIERIKALPNFVGMPGI